MQTRTLAGPVCIWTGRLTCSQTIRSVVRLTSSVSVGPRRAVVHPVSLGKPSMGGLPDGSRIKLCTMPPGISSRSLLGDLGFHWHYSVGTNSFRQERVGIIDEPSLVTARFTSEGAPPVVSRGAQGVTYLHSVHRRVNVVRDVANHDKPLITQPAVELSATCHGWLIAPRPEPWV